MANLSELRSRVSAHLGLDNAVAGDQTLLDAWINQGVLDLLMKTQCAVSVSTVTPGAAQDYTLNTEVMAILEMFTSSGGHDYPLERTTVGDIVRLRRNSQSSAPVRRYALAGADRVLFWPTPGAADTVTMYYVDRPTALSATADSPTSIPAEWHYLIELYALWRGADYDDDQTSQQGDRYLGQYEKGLREMRKEMRKRGGTRLSPAVAGRHRRPQVPVIPSQDVW